MDRGLIYYTDNRVVEPIFSKVQELLNEVGLPISSSSLCPIDFGKNVVLKNRERSYPTMVRQIIMALEGLETKYAFFCENDVLYHKSHFEFTPPKDDVFFYNSNVWRWKLWDNKAIRYDKMLPLSQLCCNREYALEHYKMREAKIIEWGLDEFRSREPRRARIWGYEPGTKSKRRGGFTDYNFDTWCSEFPSVDIRHARTFSRLKCDKRDFRNMPENWEEIDKKDIPGWDLDKVFPDQITYEQTCK